MKQIIKITLINLLCATTIFARFHLIQKSTDFNRNLQKYDYSIVCFALSQSTDQIKTSMNDSDLQYSFDQIKNRMIAASKRDDFAGFLSKDIGFLMVDMAKPGNKQLFKDFKMAFTEFPCMMLFDQDALVQVLATVPKSATEIIKLLNKQFGNEISQLVTDHWNSKMSNYQVQVPNYYQYESTPYAWYPYAVWPYSRWGIRPYELGYGLELAEYT